MISRARQLLCTAAVSALAATLAAAQPSPAATGLAPMLAEDDPVLLDELARRELSALLERAFVLGNTPPDVRSGMRAALALRKLGAEVATLSASERRERVRQIVAGISGALPRLNDSQQLMGYADLLVSAAVDEDARLLEYWGPNPATQAELKPVVQTVLKLLERCGEVARAEVAQRTATLRADDEAGISHVETLQRRADDAEYFRHLLAYQLALALDPADPARKPLLEQAAAFLARYDDAANPDQNFLRVNLGKLHALRGDEPGFAASRAAFDAVIASEGAASAPEGVDAAAFATAQQQNQFQARYFRTITELYARQPGAARTAYDELLAWLIRHPPVSDDEEEKRGIELVKGLLHYRVLSLQSELAPDTAQREQFAREASAVLLQMVNARPELEGLVMRQLVGRRAPGAAVEGEDPLVLRALLSAGEAEALRKRRETGASVDREIVTRALAAADELLKRGAARVDPKTLANAAYLRGYFLEDLGALEQRVEAARAFLAFASNAEFQQSDSERTRFALDNARALVFELRREALDNPDVIGVYEQFLRTAVSAPFAQMQFAFLYAYQLQFGQASPRLEEAIRLYRLVPTTDINYQAARFFLLVALSDHAAVQTSADSAVVEEMLRLAEQIAAHARQVQGGNDEAAKLVWRARAARALLLRARAQLQLRNDAPAALATLDDVTEAAVAGLADAPSLLGEGRYLRVQALLASNRSDEAVAQLVGLLEAQGGGRGMTLVFDVCQRLDREAVDAEVAGDTQRLASIQRNRAVLTGYLIRWVEGRSDADAKKALYGLRRLEAETQRLAAELQPDATKRNEGLASARKAFAAMDHPGAAKPWIEPRDLAQPPERFEPAADEYDPAVRLSLARIDFALGDYRAALAGFNDLIRRQSLGAPFIVDPSSGAQRDNDVYWEAHYKLFRARLALGEAADATRQDMRTLYLRFEAATGGRKWKGAFDALRKEIDSGWVPPHER